MQPYNRNGNVFRAICVTLAAVALVWNLSGCTRGGEGAPAQTTGKLDAGASEEEEDDAAPALPSSAELHLVDTGEGQAVVLDIGEVEIVIDGGEDRTALRDYLEKTELVDGPIELVVVSHTDIDAYQGLRQLIEPGGGDTPFAIGAIWLPGEYRSDEEVRAEASGARTACALTRTYRGFLDLAHRAGNVQPVTGVAQPVLATGRPDEFTLPGIAGVQFTLLHAGAFAGDRTCSVRKNNASTVLLLRVGASRVLFGGDGYGAAPNDDAATQVEAALLELEARNSGLLAADVLIAPRRGSSNASSADYVARVNPRFALFGSSVRFRHPRPEILDRYRSPGRRLLYTRLNAAAGRDHIVCKLTPAVDCRYGSTRTWTGYRQSGASMSESAVRQRLLQGVPAANGENAAQTNSTSFVAADLSGFQWRNCDVAELSLEKTLLRGTVLEGCEFAGTDLTGVDFTEALLANVVFREAKLDGADFSFADLHGARFIAATMDNVRLRGANIDGLVFEPARWSLRNPQELWKSPQLATLRYESSPHALYELREQLRDNGLRAAERDVTFMIERAANAEAGFVEGSLRWIGFDLTSEFGRRPERPLLILLALIPLFAAAYWVPIRWHTRGSVYRVPPQPSTGIPGDLTAPEQVQCAGLTAVRCAVQFSMVAAFNLGWRELNVGNWINQMQPRSYTMTATGWVRVLAGVQALISVYLLALAVLTYFGRPFG